MLRNTLAVALTFALSACGGGSSGGGSSPDSKPEVGKTDPGTGTTDPGTETTNPDPSVTTTFKVTVDNSLFEQPRAAANVRAFADDSELNFKVAVVDPSGKVLEVVQLSDDDIQKQPDGSYEIRVPGYPRLDCVIISSTADLSNLVVVNSSLEDPAFDDLLLAPTTAPQIDIDAASTIAYEQFLDSLEDGATFEALNIDVTDEAAVEQVEEIVDQVQELVSELLDSEAIDFSGLEDPSDIGSVVELILQEVDDVVEEVIANTENEVAGESVVDLFASSDSDGFYMFYGERDAYSSESFSYEDVYLDINHFPANGSSEKLWRFEYESYSGIEVNNWNSNPIEYNGMASDDLILQNSGWEHSAGFVKYQSKTSDSVRIQDLEISSIAWDLKSESVVELSDRPVGAFLASIDADTVSLGPIIKDGAKFAAGSKAYQVTAIQRGDRTVIDGYNDDGSFEFVNDYELFNSEETNYKYGNPYSSSSFDGLFSATSLSLENPESYHFIGFEQLEGEALGNSLENWTYVAVQLKNDEAKTATFYELTFRVDFNAKSFIEALRVLGSNNWEYLSVEEANDTILIDFNADFLKGIKNFGEAEQYAGAILSKQTENGVPVIAFGYSVKDGTPLADPLWGFNQKAIDSIRDSLELPEEQQPQEPIPQQLKYFDLSV